MSLLRIFEPEETVGGIWHGIASGLESDTDHKHAAVSFVELRVSLVVLFRALGGGHDVEILEAASVRDEGRRGLRERLLGNNRRVVRPSFDGASLRLPSHMAVYPTRELNKAAYLWLTATAAVAGHAVKGADTSIAPMDAPLRYVRTNLLLAKDVLAACPGLQPAFEKMCQFTLSMRPSSRAQPGGLEAGIRAYLAGDPVATFPVTTAGEQALLTVPFWLYFLEPKPGQGKAAETSPGAQAPAKGARSATKKASRRDLDQANRKDSFIVHRFESILSWAESMDINRTVDDDDENNASKAADDQDSITLTRHDRKTASRLHLHLELSPEEAAHERLAGEFIYPEWNHKKQCYMDAHCRVLEAPAAATSSERFKPDQRLAARIRRQFEPLRSRRSLQKQQTDGADLDLDALIRAQVELRASGRGDDRVHIASRVSQRDMSVALLVDTSRSTEADLGGSSVIDVSRDALVALAHGLDACGDRFGIWSFSSRRRNRVFVSCCKDFETPMSSLIDRRIASLGPGQYTRLGAAIRHMTQHLEKEPSAQKLLLVLTDGKPNDIDHYEGAHGVEDSRMAVREARRLGIVVHSVIVDEDGQDWFTRIFHRGGFTLLQRPERLTTALPEIYRALTEAY